jgi:hypothetical protein
LLNQANLPVAGLFLGRKTGAGKKTSVTRGRALGLQERMCRAGSHTDPVEILSLHCDDYFPAASQCSPACVNFQFLRSVCDRIGRFELPAPPLGDQDARFDARQSLKLFLCQCPIRAEKKPDVFMMAGGYRNRTVSKRR